MTVFVEIAEAAERLEELIALSARGDEVMICRDGRPIATLSYIARKAGTMEEVLKLAAEGRTTVTPGTTSDHDEFHDEHGLPK